MVARGRRSGGSPLIDSVSRRDDPRPPISSVLVDDYGLDERNGSGVERVATDLAVSDLAINAAILNDLLDADILSGFDGLSPAALSLDWSLAGVALSYELVSGIADAILGQRVDFTG
jgi:hypothetical protein